MRQLITIFGILVIIFTNQITLKAQTTVLNPDDKLDRKANVLSNQIYIRLKQGNYEPSEVALKLKSFGITMQKQSILCRE